MTTTNVRPLVGTPLDKDDLAALRAAESFSLHTHRLFQGSVLRLYTRSYDLSTPVFTKRQQVLFPETHTQDTRVRMITVTGSAHGYGSTNGSGGWQWPSWESSQDQEPTPECFFSGYERDTWATVVRSLRVGTVLSVVWTADNNTEISRDAGLHLDQVRLSATTGERVDTWNIGWQCSRDNSARMVRRQSY